MDLQRRNWAFREKNAFVLRIAGLSKCSGPQRSRPPCVGRKVEATEPISPIASWLGPFLHTRVWLSVSSTISYENRTKIRLVFTRLGENTVWEGSAILVWLWKSSILLSKNSNTEFIFGTPTLSPKFPQSRAQDVPTPA